MIGTPMGLFSRHFERVVSAHPGFRSLRPRADSKEVSAKHEKGSLKGYLFPDQDASFAVP